MKIICLELADIQNIKQTKMCLTKPITPTYNLKIVGKIEDYECPISKVFHNQDLREIIFDKQMLFKNLEQQKTIAKNNHKLSMDMIKWAKVRSQEHTDNFVEYLHHRIRGEERDEYICEECGVGCIANIWAGTRGIAWTEPMDCDGLMFRCKCCNWKELKEDKKFFEEERARLGM